MHTCVCMYVRDTRDKWCNEFGLTQTVLDGNRNRQGNRIATCYPCVLDMSASHAASPSTRRPHNYSYRLITASPRIHPRFPLKSPLARCMRQTAYTCYESLSCSLIPPRLW